MHQYGVPFAVEFEWGPLRMAAQIHQIDAACDVLAGGLSFDQERASTGRRR
jgi:hypothetical protein